MRELYSAAGTVVLGEERDSLLLLAKRSSSAFFYPGAYVMPGGLVSKDDRLLADALMREGVLKGSGSQEFHGVSEVAYRVTFLREFFEETGILLVKEAKSHLSKDQVIYFRQKLVKHQFSLLDLLKTLELPVTCLPIEELRYAGSRITPPFSSLKYVTRYYIYVARDAPRIIPNFQEHEEINWFRPSELLQRYERLEVVIPPPTLQQLRYFREKPLGEALLGLQDHDNAPFGVSVPIEMTPNVEVIPLLSRTLPPATTTNLVVFGGKKYVIVDPGAEAREWEHLRLLLRRLQQEKRTCVGIVLTHHHSDHVEAIAIAREETGAPVIAHKRTRELLMGKAKVDSVIDDGDSLIIEDKNGDPYELTILYTPGHTKGSISVFDKRHGVLSCGDLMSGLGTTVINPPEGDLREYLSSLRKIRELPLRLIVPGHGPLLMRPKEKIEEYLEHRHERHERIKQMLAKKPKTLMDLVRIVYVDVKEEYYDLAARSLLAHLLMLRDDGELDEKQLHSLLEGYQVEQVLHG